MRKAMIGSNLVTVVIVDAFFNECGNSLLASTVLSLNRDLTAVYTQ